MPGFAAAHPAMLEAKEVHAFPAFAQVHDPRLGFLRLKAELGQDRPQRTEGALGLPFGPAHHHEVVGIADEHPRGPRLPRPIKPVQVDVGQTARAAKSQRLRLLKSQSVRRSARTSRYWR